MRTQGKITHWNEQKAIGFIAAVAWSVSAYNIPIQILYLYLAASTFTFLVYAKDKMAARRYAWRTKESTLHTQALVAIRL